LTTLTAATATDRGRVRAINQDVALIEGQLVAVADGMGGHAAGEIAASVAVDALRDAFAADQSADGLVAAANTANRAVHDRSESNQELHGMGTTLTAAALVKTRRSEQLVLINVGDSRAYLLVDGELTQLTEDHSVVEEMRRRGDLSSAEAAVHPHRHILTRALGIDPTVEVDSWLLEARPGSRLLICSDGLTNECDEAEIETVLSEAPDPAEAARVLVARALDHGGNDNVTVVVADISGEPTGSLVAAAPKTSAPTSTSSGAADSLVPPSPAAAVPFDAEALTAAAALVPDPPTANAPTTRLPRSARQQHGAQAAPAPRPHRQPRPAPVGRLRQPREPMITVRSVAFVVVLICVLGGVAGFVGWFVRASYFVGLRGNHVVIYEGRPGGLLWFKPTVVSDTNVTKSQVFKPDIPLLQAGMLESSYARAQQVVKQLTTEQKFLGLTTTTTIFVTTTTIPVTTTTSPATTTSAATTTTVKAH
jgi:protein phosphatase